MHYFINNSLEQVKMGVILEKCRKARSKKYIFHSKGRDFKNKFTLIKADFLKYFYFKAMLLNTISYDRTILTCLYTMLERMSIKFPFYIKALTSICSIQLLFIITCFYLHTISSLLRQNTP